MPRIRKPGQHSNTPKAEATKEPKKVGHRFQPGNPGRPEGSRNKLANRFLADLYEAWEAEGRYAIARMLLAEPGDFVKVVARILPRELHVKREDVTGLSDERLHEILNGLAALGANGAAGPAVNGGTPPDGESEPDRLH